MDIDRFWGIIAKGQDSEDPRVLVAEELAKLPPDEIVSYEEHFIALVDRAYRWPLWGAAYIMQGGCGDDSFTDFRCGVISRGREVYERALADPESLADFDEDWIGNEEFGYLAWEAYQAKTGKEMPWKQIDRPKHPLGDGWDLDDYETNRQRLPRIWEKYGEEFLHPSGLNAVKKKPWWNFW